MIWGSRKVFLLWVMMICLPFLAVRAQEMNMIFEHDFENNTLGVYDRDEWREDWNTPGWSSRLSKTFIEEKDGSKVMKWIYPEGTWGLNEETGGGGQWWAPIPGFHTELYMSYNVLLKPGFDFVQAGKLPGVIGGPQDFPPGEAPGWDDGFSGGLLFKGISDPRGYLAFYTYHQDQKGAYGDSYHWPDPYSSNTLFYFKKDNVNERWVNITFRIVMNTVNSDGSGGNNDGILEGYIDGKLMGHRTDYKFRNVETIGIDMMKIYSFFGGSGEEWAPTRDEWAIFDDFHLFTFTEESIVPRGNVPSPAGRVLQIPWMKNADTVEPEEDIEAPTVPENLHSTGVTKNSIYLEWEAAQDNVRVTAYRIFVNNSVVDATTRTDYQVSGLNPGVEYELSVSAIDAAANESERSPSIDVFTEFPDTEPPTTPGGVSMIRVTGYSLEFRWEASSDNVGVDHYEISLNEESLGSSENLSYKASNLDPNTQYSIAVRAVDEAGNASPYSESLTRRTESADSQAPSTPTGLHAGAVTNKSIQLVWNPSSDNVLVSSYKVKVNNNVMAESPVNEKTLEDLKGGLSYVISVLAVDEAGNESPESDTIHVSTYNEDFTVSPKLPEVYIVDVQNQSNKPGSIAEMKSLGFAELDDYGIIVTQGDQPVEEGMLIFADNTQTEVENNEERITEGLQLLYNFSDKEGDIVSEISGAGDPVDLHISRPVNTCWIPGQGLKVIGNTTLESEGTPTRLIESLRSTNEVTMEAWISQSETEQDGPARIITLSNGNLSRAVTLGHTGTESAYNYVTRLQTTDTDANGFPELITSTNFTSTSLHHVVYTRNRQGIEKMYVNGIELSSGIKEGDFSSWDGNYQFVLGNELNGKHPWEGIFYMVAVYNQALSLSEVRQNYDSGFGKIRYTTELSSLKPNVTYELSPFVRTDQGIIYGEKKNFLIEDVFYSAEKDSLYMAAYPNPSNGDFKLHVEYINEHSQTALLRIADMTGQLVYAEELEFSNEFVNREIDINLSSRIRAGIYSVILTLGQRSVASKLIFH